MKIENEQILWNGLRRGDEKHLHSLYNLYFDDLLRYGLTLTADLELSKEYINLVFLSLWSNRERLPEVKHPKAYVVTSYKNKLIFRKKKPGELNVVSRDISNSHSPSTSSYEETLIELQEYEKLKQRLKNELASLTERQRQLIILRFFEEMTYEEIAGHLNISVRTVYNSIHESLKLLRNKLHRKDFNLFCLLLL